MIEYKKGDLLANTEGIIVHGCNAQGIMGSGVALAVKNKYPDAFRAYLDHLEGRPNPVGTTNFWRLNTDLIIANAITQQTFGTDKSVKYVSYDAIHTCFNAIVGFADTYGMSIHIPLIGAYRGNGNWEVISRIINDVVGDHEVTCWVLENAEH